MTPLRLSLGDWQDKFAFTPLPALSLEKEMATHSSVLAWKIPGMEQPGRLQSTGLQSRTRLSDFTSLLLFPTRLPTDTVGFP